ncbi:MAG: cell division protein FtsN [Halieaceae bacterium]|jgi:cell division protein FtsN
MSQQRKSGRGASRQQATPEGGALRWYGAGVFSGLFAAFLLYLVSLPAEENPAQPAEVARTSVTSQPVFDFYEVLPEQRITEDIDPAELPRERAQQAQALYMLQAGSFHQEVDADRHRAKLLLLGLSPEIEESSGSNGRWFRVVLGPFETRSAMARARSLTAQEGIDTLLVRRTPP